MEETQNSNSRAQRFPIRGAMRYRIRGEKLWREGVAENISVSGMLFRGEHFVKPNTPIEVSFVLPGKQRSGESGAKVVSHGIVVRSTVSPGESGTAMMAAKITHPRLQRL
jgi:PilZ domain